jgi:hypothetical protein
MAIKYVVREVSTSSITVDYEDGSWAVVPINSLMSKQDIERLIGDFQPSSNGFSSVNEVPFSVGESGETLSRVERELKLRQEEQQRLDEENNRLFTYADIRKEKYPDLGDQLDALYWARQGNDTSLQQIDQKIESVKNQYPKNMTPITGEEFRQSLISD